MGSKRSKIFQGNSPSFVSEGQASYTSSMTAMHKRNVVNDALVSSEDRVCTCCTHSTNVSRARQSPSSRSSLLAINERPRSSSSCLGTFQRSSWTRTSWRNRWAPSNHALASAAVMISSSGTGPCIALVATARNACRNCLCGSNAFCVYGDGLRSCRCFQEAAFCKSSGSRKSVVSREDS